MASVVASRHQQLGEYSDYSDTTHAVVNPPIETKDEYLLGAARI